jgi:hypothetical protein
MFIGISAAEVKTAAEADAGGGVRLGTVGMFDDPDDGTQCFLYVEAAEAITAAGYLCVVDSANLAEMVDTTSSAPGAGAGMRCGAAMAAIASGGQGWIQVYGKGSLRTLASAALGTALTSSATPGAVDDATTTGLEVIEGLSLGTATGGAAATNADAYFNWPYVGRTL